MTLRKPLDELLDPPEIDERAINRARSRLFGSLDHPARPRLSRWIAAGVTIAACAAAAFALWPSENAPVRSASTPGPLHLVEGGMPAVLRADGERRVLRFGDGSRVELAPGAQLHVDRNDGSHVELTLASGEVLFDVRPHGPRRWRVAMGRWTVEVIGTRFVLSRSDERLRVEVVRGLVRVVPDEGDARELGAGASVELSLIPPPPAPPPPEAVTPAPSATATPPRRAPSRWRARAAAGDAEGAYATLGASFASEVRATRDVDDLFALADVARGSGHPQQAIAPLRRIIEELPRSPRTSVAAFTLGVLYGESLGRPADAARELERALSLGLPRDLRESAAARRLDMWTRAARPDEARAAACDYLEVFPSGPAHQRALVACPSEPVEPR